MQATTKLRIFFQKRQTALVFECNGSNHDELTFRLLSLATFQCHSGSLLALAEFEWLPPRDIVNMGLQRPG
jgi:hypothetical protein